MNDGLVFSTHDQKVDSIKNELEEDSPFTPYSEKISDSDIYPMKLLKKQELIEAFPKNHQLKFYKANLE